MTDVPGLRPRSPVMTLGPVLVTVVPPSTAKLCVVPIGGATCALAAWNGAVVKSVASKAIAATLPREPRNAWIRIVGIFMVSPYRSVARWAEQRLVIPCMALVIKLLEGDSFRSRCCG